MTATLHQAIERECVWKSDEIRGAACALVKAGLDELNSGRDFFGPDCVPDELTYSQGIMGSVVHMLREAHVIEDCFDHRPDVGIVHGRRASRRPSANGRKVCLYRLTSRSMAEAFLRRHGAGYEQTQTEMAI